MASSKMNPPAWSGSACNVVESSCAPRVARNANRTTVLLSLLLAACGGGGGDARPAGGNTGGNSAPATLQSIEITPAHASVAVGKVLVMTATGHFSDGSSRPATGAVYWSSDTKAVAPVDGGIVSALSSGSALITAVSSDEATSSIAGSVTVTVVPGPAQVSYLHDFDSASDASQPNGPLLEASDGNFYGTSRAGGGNTCFDTPFFCGTVFKVSPAGVESVVSTFSTAEGYWPTAPLIQSADGSFYGTTERGGANDAGVLYRLAPDGSRQVLYVFGASAADGVTPSAVIQGHDGNFYGTTSTGGANACVEIPGDGHNCGTVFKVTPGGIESILHSFSDGADDGVEPIAPLLQASDGNLYGTTTIGGPYAGGTVFRITPDGTLTVLYAFGANPSNGSVPQGMIPQGALVEGADGALYGTTAEGGQPNCSYGCGTVFRITLDGQLSTVYAFGGPPLSDGYGPAPFLSQGRDGNLYGTTRSGGAFGGDLNGTAFMITPAGSESILYSFGPSNDNPSDPIDGMVQGSDGNLYCVTTYSGLLGAGTVFKLTREN